MARRSSACSDDPSAPPLLRPKTRPRRRPAPGDNTDRTPGVGEDVHVRPTHGGELNDLDFCPAWAAARVVPTRSLLGARPGARIGHVQSGARQVRLPPGHGRRRVRARPTRTLRSPRDPPPRPAAVLQRAPVAASASKVSADASPATGSDCAVYLEDVGVPSLAPDTPWRDHRPTPKVYVHMPPRFNQHFDTRKLDRPIGFSSKRIVVACLAADPDDADASPCTSRLG